MNFLYLVLLYITSVSADCPAICDGVCIKNYYHKLKLLKNNVDQVYDMVYNLKDKYLYVIYKKKGQGVQLPHLFKISIDTEVETIIEGIPWPTSLAFAPIPNILYVGSIYGLYKIFLDTSLEAKKVGDVNDSVISIFQHNNDLCYFVNYCQDTYLYSYSVITNDIILADLNTIKIKLDKFVIDRNHNIVYILNGSLYQIPPNGVVASGVAQILTIKDATDIALDPAKDVFISTKTGVYAYDSLTHDVKTYGDNMENIKKITFAGVDEPIFVVNDKILAFSK